MGNVIHFMRCPALPDVGTRAAGSLRRLNTISRAIRRLRAMGIAVSNALPGGNETLPTLLLRVDPQSSIAPLLEATAGRR